MGKLGTSTLLLRGTYVRYLRQSHWRPRGNDAHDTTHGRWNGNDAKGWSNTMCVFYYYFVKNNNKIIFRYKQVLKSSYISLEFCSKLTYFRERRVKMCAFPYNNRLVQSKRKVHNSISPLKQKGYQLPVFYSLKKRANVNAHTHSLAPFSKHTHTHTHTHR